jgi:hypothetical protein
LDPRPKETMEGELNAGLEPVGEDPFCQLPRLKSAVCRAEKHLLGRGKWAGLQEFSCPEVVIAALNDEFDLVLGSQEHSCWRRGSPPVTSTRPLWSGGNAERMSSTDILSPSS